MRAFKFELVKPEIVGSKTCES